MNNQVSASPIRSATGSLAPPELVHLVISITIRFSEHKEETKKQDIVTGHLPLQAFAGTFPFAKRTTISPVALG